MRCYNALAGFRVLLVATLCVLFSIACSSDVPPTPIPTPTEIPPTETPAPTATPIATATPVATRAPQSVRGEITRGDPQIPEVALTFDCGSAAGPTGTILDILRQNNLKVTFFVTGAYADLYPDMLKRIVAEGHELANHSYTHADLTTLTEQKVREEMNRTDESFMKIVGKTGKPWMRMPYGARDGRVLGIMEQIGYRSIFWTLDSGDWLAGSTKARVEQTVLNNIGNGYIVVEHCNAESSAQALPAILDGLKERGLRVVTISTLLGMLPAAPTPTPAKPTATPASDPFLAPVSKSYSLAADYTPPDLVPLIAVQTAVNGLQVRSGVVAALKAMLDEAQQQGHAILPISTYRSYQQQAALYQNYVNQMGEAAASRISARAGQSEHQLGTTIDFTSAKANYDLTESFGALPEGRWLKDNAHRFGFIMSYPEGRESTTGYSYEPWHYRYVGVDVASAVQKSGLTLLEYLSKR